MLTPRPYLSFSQMTTFEMSPDKFLEEYIYKKRKRITRNIALGSNLADALKDRRVTGDPLLDLMISKIPKYELMDVPVEDPKNGIEIYNEHDKKTYKVPFLLDGNIKIPLLAIPDSATKDYSKFYEYKTSTKKWGQSAVDKSGQITFYATAIWLVTKKVPIEIGLTNLTTEYGEYGQLSLTGDIYSFKTKRTLVDIIKMTARIKSAWAGIQELCESELL